MVLLSERWLFDVGILLSIAFFLAYLYVTRFFDYWKKRGVPFVKPFPFLGNIGDVFLLRTQMGPCLRVMYEKMQGPFFGMFFLTRPVIMLKDPELIKNVLIKDFSYFSDHVMCCDESCDPVAANLLFATKNPAWRIIRNKITPIFSSGKIKNMFGLIKEAGEDMANYLKTNCNSGDIIEIREVSGKFSTDVIASTGFGINANSFKNEHADFRRVARETFGFNLQTSFPQVCYLFFPSIVKMFKLKFFADHISDFCRTVFWATIREREENKLVRHDFVDIVIDIRRNETVKELIKFEGDKVIGQAVQFFTAGFETTSIVLARALYELAHQPEIQQRARKEVIDCLHDGFSFQAMQEMKYLDMVVAEVLRKHPVFPFLDREAVMDYPVPESKLVIQKGLSVIISVYGLHYDPQYFPDPQKFDPERFTEENKKRRPACTYLPFGEGPRACIGSRFALVMLKVGLASILKEYEVETCESTVRSIRYSPLHFMLSPLDPINLRFKKPQ